ncbi:MAG: hypothetical protein ABG776_08140, partial [Cyanobacteria bacterium J06555_13]
EKVAVRKLTVVRVDSERNLLLIKGAVPGKANNGQLTNGDFFSAHTTRHLFTGINAARSSTCTG